MISRDAFPDPVVVPLSTLITNDFVASDPMSFSAIVAAQKDRIVARLRTALADKEVDNVQSLSHI